MGNNASELMPTGPASACNLNPGKAKFYRRSGPERWHFGGTRVKTVAFLTLDIGYQDIHWPDSRALLAAAFRQVSARVLLLSFQIATENGQILSVSVERITIMGAKNGCMRCCR